MLTITARIQQTPPDHRDGYELGLAELERSAPSYDQAIDQVRTSVPDGWRILFVRVDRPTEEPGEARARVRMVRETG